MKGLHLHLALICCILSSKLYAQHSEPEENSATHKKSSYFHVSFVLAHTYLPESTSEGSEILALPSLGLDLEYWFNSKFGIGLHNDVELLAFGIEEGDNTFIERERPLLITADFLWSPFEHASLFAGPGIEIEKEQNYAVFKLGFEYTVHASESLGFSPLIFYDYRINAYNSLSIGIGIAYKFGGSDTH